MTLARFLSKNMKKERTEIVLNHIQLNEGQLSWLPKNPRTWTQTDIDKTAASIKEDPDFLEDRPLLVVAIPGTQDFTVFAGNLRSIGARAAKRSKVPCVLYTPETDADYETIKRRAMKDNGAFGQMDWDEVFSSEWGTMPLDQWGLTPKSWNEEKERITDLGLTTEGVEGGEGYDEFVDKFKPKLTTDDCYTPPAVYDAVLRFVGTITKLEGRKIERPFVPGGDFENYPYTKRSIVVDNPPFSLLSKICRFYCERQIPFFIFGPALTLFSARDCDLTYIIPDSEIEYENGARVLTGFITNLIKDIRIWCCPELGQLIDEAQPDENKEKQGFVYPDNIVTAALLGKITKRGIELKIRKKSCEPISDSDSAKEQGRGLYGGGYMLSDKAAAERAAAEREALQKAIATRLNLSDREKAIIARLNEQDV